VPQPPAAFTNVTLDALLEKMRLLEKEIVRELQGADKAP
jgi:hypothetical protein